MSWCYHSQEETPKICYISTADLWDNKRHLACGCQGPKHRSAFRMPSPGCPGCFSWPVPYCVGHPKHLSNLSETLGSSHKGYCSPMAFPDNPEQWMNREVHAPFAVPMGSPQSAPVLCKPSMHSVVTVYWCISLFPLKTRAVFGRH